MDLRSRWSLLRRWMHHDKYWLLLKLLLRIYRRSRARDKWCSTIHLVRLSCIVIKMRCLSIFLLQWILDLKLWKIKFFVGRRVIIKNHLALRSRMRSHCLPYSTNWIKLFVNLLIALFSTLTSDIWVVSATQIPRFINL